MANVPEWAKTAAEEICDINADVVGGPFERQAAAIIAKHAPDVRALVQAAREMCCWVGHETFPHSFNADISRLHRALEPFTKEVNRG